MSELSIVSPMTEAIVAAGRKEHFFYEPLGIGQPITAPVFMRRQDKPWWWIDKREAHINVPYFAERAKYPIIKSGFNIVQEIVAEEVPPLLTVEREPPPAVDYRQQLEGIFTVTGRALRAIGQGVLAVVSLALLIDPALIAVIEVENGKYAFVEVCWWYP